MAAPEVPKQHKALVYAEPGKNKLAVEMVDTPKPGPGEVLVNLTHSGVCHSDYAVMMNAWPALPYPTPAKQVGGHEGVGLVAALGEGVSSRKIGERVGIKWIARACTTCQACLDGHDGVCFNQAISGYYYPGTYQQFVIGPADYVTPIPDGLSSEVAAPMLCAGVTTYSALRRSNARPGQWVAISGAGGGLGHIAVQLAAKGFAFRVIGIDVPNKKDFVLQSGAEHFVDATQDPARLAEEVKKLSDGLGVQSSIIVNSQAQAYASGLEILRYNGTLVCVGLPEKELEPIRGAAPAALVFKLSNITSVAVGNGRDATEVLEMAARGVVSTKVEVRKMEDLERTFNQMEERSLLGRVVLDLS